MRLNRPPAGAAATIAAAAIAAVFALNLSCAQAQDAKEVNVYTTREPALFTPIAQAFTAKTGVKVNTVFVKDGLGERVASEGAGSPADLLITVDIGALIDLVDRGVTQPLASKAVETAVPANLRAADGAWSALSLRARLVWAAKSLNLTDIAYENLADPKWKGKICTRAGQHPYNTALLAALIAHDGADRAQAWAVGVKANLARKPGGGDRDVARDILGGLCDIGVGNSYYVGLMRSGKGGPEQKKWGDGVNVVLARFAAGGVHVNASGVVLAKHAPHAAQARQLVEFLVSPEGQKIYAEQNFEYPVRPDAGISPVIAALGTLKPDTIPLADIARYRKTASQIFDKVGFDQ
ncbi:MAG: extracellular solute-binding protein [Rhodoblastus sp.]